MNALPEHGLPPDEVLRQLRELRAGDLPTHGGHTLAYVYDSGQPGLDDVAAQAHALAAQANALDPTAFPGLLRMENGIVAAAAQLLRAPETAAGSVTSGGTESCLLAVLAARDAHPEITAPEMVLPATAHAAFHKAAHYFGVRPVVVDVDPATFRADPAAMAQAIGDNTVLVVVSAPSYPHGVIDPVAAIAGAARERGVRCHVDACIGGWVLPYFRRLGAALPAFDFTVPGVSSMAVDLHKYAYCPKGVSVLLHADAELRRTHYYASAAWPGYTMLNSTMQSTRSGGPLAAAWAVLRHLGDDGYLRLAAATRDAVREIRHGVAAIDGLRLLGEPDATLLALSTEDGAGFDLFTVADEMRERGWYVQPQFAFGELPVNLHLTVAAANRGTERELLDALADSVAAARKAGPVRLPPELVAAVAELDPDTLTSEQFTGLLAAAGIGGEDGAMPERMAEINALLAQLPAPARERVMVEFLGVLQRC